MVIFFILYIGSFFWFKTNWKRWTFWAVLILSLGEVNRSEEPGAGQGALMVYLIIAHLG